MAIVSKLNQRGALRLSAGLATVQPPGAWLDTPFVPTSPFVPLCSAPSSIGSVASADLSYSHRWNDSDETVVAAYTGFLRDKLYNATVPLSQLPAGAYGPTVVATYTKQLDAACGLANAGLGATGYVNLGSVQTRGIQITGRHHLSHNVALTYAWSEQSAILQTANAAVLQDNLTLIPGAQLPAVPMHKASLGFQYRRNNGIGAELTQTFVAANNPASLPAYSFGNVALNAPIGPGRLNLVVSNVFNQFAGDRSLLGLGQP